MKTIIVAFSFFAVAYSAASDVATKTPEQRAREAREIERVALFFWELERPEEQAKEGWTRPDVQKQMQRNRQWEDDSNDFNIMRFFLSQEYEQLGNNDAQLLSQAFTDEFGNTKFLDFKKKDGFITEFGIDTPGHPHHIRCDEDSDEVKVINDAIKYKQKGPNVGMSTNFFPQATSAGKWDPVPTEALEKRTICSRFWYPFAWLLYGNGVARWLGYGTKVAKKATIKEKDKFGYAYPETIGSQSLSRFRDVEDDVKMCLTEKIKNKLKQSGYSNLHAAYDAYCFALLSFRHVETKDNEIKAANIFDGFLKAKKSGSWNDWVDTMPLEYYDDLPNGAKSKQANVEKAKLACMKVYNAYETLIMAAHTFFEEAQNVVDKTPNGWNDFYKSAFNAVECPQDQTSKDKFDATCATIASICKINVNKVYTNVFDRNVIVYKLGNNRR